MSEDVKDFLLTGRNGILLTDGILAEGYEFQQVISLFGDKSPAVSTFGRANFCARAIGNLVVIDTGKGYSHD